MYDFVAITLRLQTTETPDCNECVNRNRGPKQDTDHFQERTDYLATNEPR